MHAIPVLKRLGQENYHEFKARMGYTVRPCLKVIKKTGAGNVTQLVGCLPIRHKALSYAINQHGGLHL